MDNRFGEMEVFARVAALGSFSAAARELAMTPSAISRLVSRLEDRLRVRLLVRSTRNLTLTPEGEAYLGETRALLDRLAEMEARLTDGAQARRAAPCASVHRLVLAQLCCCQWCPAFSPPIQTSSWT